MTTIEHHGGGLLDNLPLLTQVADEDAPDDLPTLTEVVTEEQAEPAACASNEEEMQRLLRQIEAHLENAFTHKLSVHLEQLQRQAIEQAVSELKAELPELLREMLNTHRPHP